MTLLTMNTWAVAHPNVVLFMKSNVLLVKAPQKVKKNMKTMVMYSVLGVIKREDTAIFQAAWLILHLQSLKTHLNPFLPLSLTKASFCFSHSLTRLNCMQDVLVATQELNAVWLSLSLSLSLSLFLSLSLCVCVCVCVCVHACTCGSHRSVSESCLESKHCSSPFITFSNVFWGEESMPEPRCRGQRTTRERWFPPSTMWVPGTNLRLGGGHLYLPTSAFLSSCIQDCHPRGGTAYRELYPPASNIIQGNTQGWGYDSEGKGTHCASLKTLVLFPRTHMKVGKA